MALCAIAPAAFAQDGSDWLSKDRFMLRGRLIGVLPDGDGVVEGTSLATDVSNSLTPELDVSYFFTPPLQQN
jgi:outer membrane protein W